MPKKRGEESIHHFSHKHELFFYRRTDDDDWPPCAACGSAISINEDYFQCDRCDSERFCLHKLCAELPRKLKHPFHQQHSLTLLDEPPWRKDRTYNCQCSACGKLCTRFTYECSECKFYIHGNCAMLFPTTRLPAKHQKLRHPHPLFVCERNILQVEVDFQCGGCIKSFDDYSTLIYVCLQCQVLLHKSCADLPQYITRHPLHPDCTLAFHTSPPPAHDEPSNNYPGCDFCRNNNSRLYFQCSDCSIKLDIHCSSLTPCTTRDYEPLVVGEEQDRGHPHPLIRCNINVNHYGLRNCDGCEKPLQKSAYYCVSCKLILHESCARLPHQIQHPFHPDHPLTLSDSTDHFRGKGFTCKSCLYQEGKRFAYLCHPCDFYLELHCISPPLYPMISIPAFHQHPLTFSDIKPRTFSCFFCRDEHTSSFSPGFRCISCNFNIHAHCFRLLPPTVKAPWHRHPLRLTPNHIGPGASKVLYCDVCENERSPRSLSYNCEECDLASHVHCVISQVMNFLQEISTSVLELAGDTKLLELVGPTVNNVPMNSALFSHAISAIDGVIESASKQLEEDAEKCIKLEAALDAMKQKFRRKYEYFKEIKESRSRLEKNRLDQTEA